METSPDRATEAIRVQGRWFEELATGDTFESPARTVTEADIALFAGLSGDFNPLHVDEGFARRTAFRGRIAHGLLVQSIASGLGHQTGIFQGTIAALAEMHILFRAPVRAGDTIRLRLGVLEKEAEPSRRRGWVRFDTVLTNQSGELVIEGDWMTIFLRRPREA